MMVHPTDHTSQAVVVPVISMISGAIQYGVPTWSSGWSARHRAQWVSVSVRRWHGDGIIVRRFGRGRNRGVLKGDTQRQTDCQGYGEPSPVQ